MKFHSCRIIPHYFNNKFALHMHTFTILFCFSTHLTLPFIKTLDSWLFHITKISISGYITKNFRNNITIHFIIFWYYKKFTQRYKHRIHYKSLCFFVSLKTWIKITTESHVLLKKIPKQQLKSMVYQNKFYGFLLQVPTGPPTFFPKICV